MEKQFNREEKLIKKLLNEAGTEQPSADFKSRIMQQIEAKQAQVKVYKPLIPMSVWYIVGVLMIVAMGALYYQYSGVDMDFFSFDLPKLSMPKINLPNLHFSRTMQYAIAFVALFFLQIPFLKRFMDNQRM